MKSQQQWPIVFTWASNISRRESILCKWEQSLDEHFTDVDTYIMIVASVGENVVVLGESAGHRRWTCEVLWCSCTPPYLIDGSLRSAQSRFVAVMHSTKSRRCYYYNVLDILTPKHVHLITTVFSSSTWKRGEVWMCKVQARRN